MKKLSSTLVERCCYVIPGKVMIAGEYGILLGFHPALACTLQRFLWVEAQLHRAQQRGGVWATSTLWPEPRWTQLRHFVIKSTILIACNPVIA